MSQFCTYGKQKVSMYIFACHLRIWRLCCVLYYYFRFYSHNSSFLHCGIDPPDEEPVPAVGQNVSSFSFLLQRWTVSLPKLTCW